MQLNTSLKIGNYTLLATFSLILLNRGRLVEKTNMILTHKAKHIYIKREKEQANHHNFRVKCNNVIMQNSTGNTEKRVTRLKKNCLL